MRVSVLLASWFLTANCRLSTRSTVVRFCSVKSARMFQSHFTLYGGAPRRGQNVEKKNFNIVKTACQLVSRVILMIHRSGHLKKIVNWSIHFTGNGCMPLAIIIVGMLNEFSRAFCCQMASKLAKSILTNI